jgi:hypothetical protein
MFQGNSLPQRSKYISQTRANFIELLHRFENFPPINYNQSKITNQLNVFNNINFYSFMKITSTTL